MNISVVIPLYNKRPHIARALKSVLTQTYPANEILVVDDGSTDGSGEVVKEFKDPRLRLITQPNYGVSVARNRGVEEASCPWVAFLDADDEWLPCFLEAVGALHARFPNAGAYGTKYVMMRPGGQEWRPFFDGIPLDPGGGIIPNFFRATLAWHPLSSSSTVVSKKSLRAVGGFPAGVRIGEDVWVWLSLALQIPVAWSPRVAVVHHLDSVNRSSGYLYIGDIPFTPDLGTLVREGMDSSMLQDLREVLVRWRFSFIKSNWLAGEKKVVRHILQETRHTDLFHKQYLLWKVLAIFPHSVVVGAWKANQIIHGRRPILPPVANVRDPGRSEQQSSARWGGA